MEVYVARQPIFDRTLNIYGYELLYRRSMNNFYEGIDDTQATAELINNAFLSMHISKLTGGSYAFINFSHEMIIKQVPRLLPNKTVVVEVLENVQVTRDLVAALRRIKEAGYLIALDDFVFREEYLPLLDLADIVKIECNKVSKRQQLQLMRRYQHRIHFLAEKIETREEFETALDMGYTYFQGYFFSKPVILKSKEVTCLNMTLVRALEALYEPEPNFEAITRVVGTDIGLSYKLLRVANSVLIGKRHKITSLKHALVQLGIIELRKWIYILMLQKIRVIENKELISICLIRAKMMELIAIKKGKLSEKLDYFITGMFSSIDVLLNQNMQEALVGLPLNDAVNAALTGKDNHIKRDLDSILALEQCYASEPEVLDQQLMPIYLEALEWLESLNI